MSKSRYLMFALPRHLVGVTGTDACNAEMKTRRTPVWAIDNA